MRSTFHLLLLVLFTTYTFAQNLEIGGQLGVNSANLIFANSSSEWTTRTQFALTGEYSFSDHFSLNGQIGYTGLGAKDFNEGNISFSGVDNIDLKIDYLNFGLAMRYYFFTADRKLAPFIALGPSLRFMISANDRFGDVDDEVIRSKTDVSTSIGIGGKYRINNSLSAEIYGGYDRGWSKTLSVPRTNTSNNVSETLFNQSVFLVVGIKKSI